MLEMLDRANLFIVPLDEERRWYRYHHLFTDLLRHRLRQTLPAEEAALHKRASVWYEQNGFVDEAIEHAFWAEDSERAAQLIARTVDDLWEHGDDRKLRHWLDRLPAGLVFSSPQFCIVLAWNHLASGEQDQAEKTLETAERALTHHPENGASQGGNPTVGLSEQVLQGRIATTRAFAAFYRGDIPAISQHASTALDYLPKHELSWRSTAAHLLGDAYDLQGEVADAYRARVSAVEVSKETGNSYVSMIANLKLAIILRRRGLLQQTLEICEQQMQIAEESRLARTAVTGWLLSIWGETLAELNDLDKAVQKGEAGVARLERGGDLAMLGSSYLGLIRILFSSGDLSGAEAITQRAERAARSSSFPPWMLYQTAAWQARIRLALGDQTAVSRWMHERELDAGNELSYLRELEYIVFARTLIADGKLDDAESLLGRLLEAAKAAERTSRLIEILILQALAYQIRGATDQATAVLERGLVLAEAGGFIRTFVDEGAPMADLLRKALARGSTPNYTKKLLSEFLTSLPKQNGPTQPEIRIPQSALLEPLSERELEVLQLIAEGFPNREIANRLFLSLNTVKAHTRNIYSKLDVHNRTQAVARARESGILPLM
jgi:LuxR family maltose regulon positive regulatory protein